MMKPAWPIIASSSASASGSLSVRTLSGDTTQLRARAYMMGNVIVCLLAAMARPFRRSEEHTSELQSLMRISYAVFCLKKKKTNNQNNKTEHHMTESENNIM